jgi:hypothetical protein
MQTRPSLCSIQDLVTGRLGRLSPVRIESPEVDFDQLWTLIAKCLRLHRPILICLAQRAAFPLEVDWVLVSVDACERQEPAARVRPHWL